MIARLKSSAVNITLLLTLTVENEIITRLSRQLRHNICRLFNGINSDMHAYHLFIYQVKYNDLLMPVRIRIIISHKSETY